MLRQPAQRSIHGKPSIRLAGLSCLLALSAGCLLAVDAREKGPGCQPGAGVGTSAPACTLSDVPVKDSSGPIASYKHYREVLMSPDCTMDKILLLLAEETTKQAPPQSEHAKFLEIIKTMAPPTVTVTKQTITGNKAELLVKAPSTKVPGSAEMKTTGVISMSRENGQWKIIKESWNTSNLSTSDAPVSPGTTGLKTAASEAAKEAASDNGKGSADRQDDDGKDD